MWYSVDMIKRDWSYPEIGSRWKLRSIPEAEVVILPRQLYGMVTFRMRAYEDEESYVHTLAMAWFYAAHTLEEKGESPEDVRTDDYRPPQS